MIGLRIKKLRKQTNMTQKELGEKIGVTTSMIGMYETDARNPSYEILNKLSDFFNVTIDYLMGETPFKNKIEAQHSISIATIKELKNNLDEYMKYIDPFVGIDLMKNNDLRDEVIIYCDNLLNKFFNLKKLNNMELFELSMIIFNNIKWSADYDGKVYLEDYEGMNLLLELNFDIIEKITLNLSNSHLLKITNSNDFYIEQAPNLLNLSTFNTIDYNMKQTEYTSIDPKYKTILTILEKNELSEEEIEEIKNYINFLLAKRKNTK